MVDTTIVLLLVLDLAFYITWMPPLELLSCLWCKPLVERQIYVPYALFYELYYPAVFETTIRHLI